MRKLNLYLIAATLAASAFNTSYAAKLDDAKVVFKDFDKIENYQDINLETTSAAEDMKSLLVDTTKTDGATRRILATKDGLLQPDTFYTVRLKFKLAPSDFSKLPNMKLRAISGGNNWIKEFHMGASKPNSFVKMTFKTPEADPNSKVVIEASGQFTGSISSFAVEKSDGETFIPVADGAKAFEQKLENLPTGTEEFTIDQPKPAKELVVNAADFGLNENIENAATVINKALAHCKKVGASKLILPKGRYKMYENACINLSEFTDFTVDGQGSVFIARKTESANMAINSCLRTKVCNLNFDYDWASEPLAAVVEIVKIDKNYDKKYTDFDVKFVEYDKYPLYGKPTRIANMENYDPVAKAVGQEGGKSFGFGFGPDTKGPDSEWIEPNVLRVKCNWVNESPELNKFYRIQHYYYGMGGLATIDNKHLTLENINIYSCKGHGILVSGNQEYFQFINVNIRPPEGEPRRTITCTADHLHFARSRGHFKMIGCEFCLGSDDCINIHDLSAFGVKCDENVIQLKAGSMPNVGDVVELRHGDYSPAKFKSEVVNVVNQGNDKRFIYFKDKIPTPRFDGFILFNRVYDSSHVLIRDCYFHSNRARGLLILASNMTIENCKFYHNQMGALKFETGYTFNVWSEGFGVNNILVRNCSFDSVNPQGVKYQDKVRDIFMGVYMRHDPSHEQTKFPVIKNILFENNKFKNSYGVIAIISSAESITFKDNTFENPSPRKVEMPYRGAFYINHASNIKIINNTWIKSPYVTHAGLFVDEDTSKDITFEGNKIIDSK